MSVALRRTTTAGFGIDQATTLDAFQECDLPAKLLLPVDALLTALPQVHLDEPEARRYALGQTVPFPDVHTPRPDGVADITAVDADCRLRVYAPNDIFLGTAERRGRWLKPHRSMAFNKELSS